MATVPNNPPQPPASSQPPAPSQPGDRSWGGVRMRNIIEALLITAIIWLAATMYANKGTEAETAAELKELHTTVTKLETASGADIKVLQNTLTKLETSSAADIKAIQGILTKLETSSATAAQLKTLEDKVADLKADAVTLSQAVVLEDKISELKTNQVSSVAIQNAINTATTEITSLRNQIAGINTYAVKHEAEIVTNTNEINTLRRQEEETCTLLAQLRERIATLEAKQATEQKPAAK